jgi:hypothetical protein
MYKCAGYYYLQLLIKLDSERPSITGRPSLSVFSDELIASSFGWWLELICYERKVLLAGCWFVLRGKYWWLISQTNRVLAGSLRLTVTSGL